MTRTETTTLTKKAESYKKLQHYIKALQEDLDRQKAEIIEMMEGADSVTVNAFIIKNQTVETTRLDTKTIKAQLPEIYNRFAVKTTSTRFTIS